MKEGRDLSIRDLQSELEVLHPLMELEDQTIENSKTFFQL